jgi:hypothetical protein
MRQLGPPARVWERPRCQPETLFLFSVFLRLDDLAGREALLEKKPGKSRATFSSLQVVRPLKRTAFRDPCQGILS